MRIDIVDIRGCGIGVFERVEDHSRHGHTVGSQIRHMKGIVQACETTYLAEFSCASRGGVRSILDDHRGGCLTEYETAAASIEGPGSPLWFAVSHREGPDDVKSCVGEPAQWSLGRSGDRQGHVATAHHVERKPERIDTGRAAGRQRGARTVKFVDPGQPGRRVVQEYRVAERHAMWHWPRWPAATIAELLVGLLELRSTADGR